MPSSTAPSSLVRIAPRFALRPRAAIIFFSASRYSAVASAPMNGSVLLRVKRPITENPASLIPCSATSMPPHLVHGLLKHPIVQFVFSAATVGRKLSATPAPTPAKNSLRFMRFIRQSGAALLNSNLSFIFVQKKHKVTPTPFFYLFSPPPPKSPPLLLSDRTTMN